MSMCSDVNDNFEKGPKGYAQGDERGPGMAETAEGEKARRGAALSGALAAVAGALALFGGVELWGVSLSLLSLPLSTEKLADALGQLASSVQSVLPFSVGRLDGMVAFLERLSSGDLAELVLAVVAVHALLTLGAVVVGLVAARRASTGRALVAAVLAGADVAAVWATCAYANSQLYLALHSLAQGNPWAVGRGVVGLPAELAPTLGMMAALVLAVLAAMVAVRSLVTRRRAA